MFRLTLYQLILILAQFEGANLTPTALKISHLEQLNSKIFGLLSKIFSRLKIDHLIKLNWYYFCKIMQLNQQVMILF
ncbi:hypothetical protein CBQ28_16730 [Pseudoalteromonas sp. GCY]|nr:hypothetical protein CBQ28_16730 [Pseudoalteromonas sp. GCY]